MKRPETRLRAPRGKPGRKSGHVRRINAEIGKTETKARNESKGNVKGQQKRDGVEGREEREKRKGKPGSQDGTGH